MTDVTIDTAFFDRCAADPAGPVALHMRQELLPVEGRGAPFFPPTYAGKGAGGRYNIDTLADGTQVAAVDSVGSQANRIEPIFLEPDYRALVPQIDIAYKHEDEDAPRSISLLEAGHRLGDAIVRCTALGAEAHDAFLSFARGDASPLAKLAPTSLVFGAWDSRDTQAKIPRIVQATVRAWDVSKLSRSAQYVPAADYAAMDFLSAAQVKKSKDDKDDKSDVSVRGYSHVPSEAAGGVIARGPIQRDLTVNLVQLRRLCASKEPGSDETRALRDYVLGLALVAATAPSDPFLRQGCLLVPDPDTPSRWELVERDGSRKTCGLTADEALEFARAAADEFGVGPDRPDLVFDKKLAQVDLKKK